MVTRHRDADLGQRAGQQVLGERVVAEEAGEQRGQQPVLVLGPLCPSGDQVGQLEEPRRQVPGGDLAVVVLVEQPALASPQVLADVVEVDVDGRGVAPARPVLGGRVEHHLDVLGPGGLALDQRAQRRVHLVDHSRSVSPRHRSRTAGAGPPRAHDRLPVRAVRPARLVSAPTGSAPVLRHYAGSSPRTRPERTVQKGVRRDRPDPAAGPRAPQRRTGRPGRPHADGHEPRHDRGRLLRGRRVHGAAAVGAGEPFDSCRSTPSRRPRR